MTTPERPDATLETAIDWLTRLQATPQAAALRGAWAAWIAADAAHHHAWRKAERAWALVGEVPPVHAARWNGDAITPPRAPPGAMGRRRLAAGAMAIAASALAVAVLPQAALWLRADYGTGTAELRLVTLADGSTIHLSPRSAIAVTFTPTTRDVALLAGEAFFTVAPDPARPFTASAAGLAVQVVGTAFDLRLGEESLEVAVQHGRVQLAYDASAPPLRAELAAGDRLGVVRAGGAVTRGRMPVTEVAAWREGLLFVQDAPVAEVVETLRRYHQGWLVLRDPALAARRVTGLYDLGNVPRALGALLRPHGGRIRSLTPFVILVEGPA